jgi:hypothetical protein
MRIAGFGLVVAAGLSLSACSTLSQYCSDSPLVCALTAKAVVGGVILVAVNAQEEPPAPSDSRLKTDIEYLTTLDNGVKLYTFRYLGDDRVFAGAMAQDLLADPRHAHAVSINAQGFFFVDYSALGLGLENGEAMREAGNSAMRLAAT